MTNLMSHLLRTVSPRALFAPEGASGGEGGEGNQGTSGTQGATGTNEGGQAGASGDQRRGGLDADRGRQQGATGATGGQQQQQGATGASGATAGDGGRQQQQRGRTDPLGDMGLPQDWREQLAGGDTKMLSDLKRYTFQGLVNSWRAAQVKISSGDLRPTLPENATEEERTAWRAASGIPEKPDGYLKDLPNNIVIGQEDKQLADSFLAAAHKNDMPPKAAQAMLGWWWDMRTQLAQEGEKLDEQVLTQADDKLHQEWGAEFRKNINLAKVAVDMGGEEFYPLLMGARLADGSLLADSYLGRKWLAELGRKVAPMATLLGNDGAGQADIASELATLRKRMREDRDGWFKDSKAQARYQELVAAEEQMGQGRQQRA